MEEYIKFLTDHSTLYDFFVELDIGILKGMDWVRGWRKRLIKARLYDRCIICYHPADEPASDFLAAMRKTPSHYVALEGPRAGRTPMNYLEMLKHCFDARVRVHGFALVKHKFLDKFPFYSVDSSTWVVSVQRYGRMVLGGKPGRWTQRPLERP